MLKPSDRRRGKTGRPRKYSEEQRLEARRLRDAGYSYSQIDDALGTPRGNARHWLRREEDAREALERYHEQQEAKRLAELPKVARQVGGDVGDLYVRLRKALSVWDQAILSCEAEQERVVLRQAREAAYKAEALIGEVLRRA